MRFAPRLHTSYMLNMLVVFVLAGSLLSAGCVPSPMLSSQGVSQEQAQVNSWVQSLGGLTPLEQARRAEAVWSNANSPKLLRERAAYLVSTRPGSQAFAAQQALSRAYVAGGVDIKKSMERMLMADLMTADDASLRVATDAFRKQQMKLQSTFPWSMITWRAAKRGLLADNAAALRVVEKPGLYADPSLLGMQRAAPVPQETAKPGTAGCVALLLPLSGPVSAIGKQVVEGADMAKAYLAQSNINMDVRIIDTEQPNWLTQTAALPAVCVAVGGPLRGDTYTTLKAQGTPGRVLFTFLPQLPTAQGIGSDEGVSAWRFFTSPQDQIDAVLDFASRDAGVTSFGVLAPEDPYGQRMSALFLQSVQQRGLTATTSTYAASDMGSWTRTTGQFVEAVATEKGKIPTARASFEAVFLPDSWKNMDMLISTMHYHGASKKIMLGTSLWEQGLAMARNLNTNTYALSVYPAVWNSHEENTATVALRNALLERSGSAQTGADWIVLGFDFVRFASSLNLTQALTPQQLNSRLASGVTMDWAGAPIRWNAQGQASRRLFLMQPTRNGSIPLDKMSFANYRAGAGPAPNVEYVEPIAPDAASLDLMDPATPISDFAPVPATPAATPAAAPIVPAATVTPAAPQTIAPASPNAPVAPKPAAEPSIDDLVNSITQDAKPAQ